MPKSDYYKLDGHIPVPAESITEAMQGDRQVALEERNGIKTSTVFLGIDHQFFGDGPPLLFETMIFGGLHDQWQERCSTWEEAESLHKHAVSIAYEESESR